MSSHGQHAFSADLPIQHDTALFGWLAAQISKPTSGTASCPAAGGHRLNGGFGNPGYQNGQRVIVARS